MTLNSAMIVSLNVRLSNADSDAESFNGIGASARLFGVGTGEL